VLKLPARLIFNLPDGSAFAPQSTLWAFKGVDFRDYAATDRVCQGAYAASASTSGDVSFHFWPPNIDALLCFVSRFCALCVLRCVSGLCIVCVALRGSSAHHRFVCCVCVAFLQMYYEASPTKPTCVGVLR
jgi:hypothetical protein